ncbi:MAG: phage integrase N-terminal SAM-like domain-containing protein, partial [Clostridia bacterium]|nr:phage integrase N-terminal SAM-like domain-containing protein [Clostridia bacterium]
MIPRFVRQANNKFYLDPHGALRHQERKKRLERRSELLGSIKAHKGVAGTTWKNAVEQLLAHLAGSGRAENTQQAYRLDLAGFARWYKKAARTAPEPAGVGPFDIAEYRRWLLDAGRKPSTVNRALGVLSQFFAWALKNSLASEDPASGLRRVPEAARPPRALGR